MSLFRSLACILLALPVAAVGADSYAIDPEHTYPSLEFDHLGLSTWRAKFNKSAGRVTLDRAARTGSVEVVVYVESIDFGNRKMNEVALTADWLDFDHFPTMAYRGRVVFTGEAPTSVDGQLTLLGVSKPLALQINRFKCMPHPLLRKEMCGADAEGELDRTEFGMKQYPQGKQIHLRIQVEALKEN